MRSCRASATGRASGCCGTSGISTSTARRRWRSSTGRERIYFEHFWNDFAADPAQSVSEADRQFYAKAYAQPGAMRAGFEVFRAFEQDAKDFAGFAKTKLTMPMLVLTGEKAGGEFLIDAGPPGRRQRRGRRHQGLGPLADRRSAGSGHTEAGGVLLELNRGTTAWGRARFAFCPCPRLLPIPRPRARVSALPNNPGVS